MLVEVGECESRSAPGLECGPRGDHNDCTVSVVCVYVVVSGVVSSVTGGKSVEWSGSDVDVG